jgi:hypothetical protein
MDNVQKYIIIWTYIVTKSEILLNLAVWIVAYKVT